MSSYLYSLYETLNIRDSRVGIGTTLPTEDLHVESGSIYVNRITNSNSNINFAYSLLDNVKEIRLDKLSSFTTSTINVDTKNLSNVDTVSVKTVTSDDPTIYFNSKSLSNITDIHVINDVRVGKNLYASNLYVVGEFTTLDTVTSNTEQMTITNAGTGPALIVHQTGPEDIATFYDDTNVAMVIADTSKVGINTSSPTERLHIYESDFTKALYTHIHSTSNNATQVKLTNMYGDTFVGPTASDTVEFRSTANKPMLLGTNGLTDTLSLATDGNVGIGRTTALYKLDVAGKTRLSDALYINTGGMNVITYSFGKQSYSTTGNASIGVRLEWNTVTTDNKLTFRTMIKCHLASDSNVAYRKFESLITPANSGDKPKQIVATEIADTSNDKFVNLTHTVTRASTKSVDLVITWTAAEQPYLGNVQIEVFAASDLGDFTFTPLP